jgi:hypothetical protein
VKTDLQFAKVVEASDGVFSVQNWDNGLVELLPDPRKDSYRFSAEVRHERQTNKESRVGIYFSHSELPDGETVAHFHCNVFFNDLVDVGANANALQRGNIVGLRVQRQPPRGQITNAAVIPNAQTFFLPAKPVWALGPWHRITVEMRPETIKVFWKKDCDAIEPKEECIATTPRSLLMRNARRLIAKPDEPLPANSPPFAPRGGLGLYVSQGVASFRNVTVEPLGDEK